jgi:hypothetical protein
MLGMQRVGVLFGDDDDAVNIDTKLVRSSVVLFGPRLRSCLSWAVHYVLSRGRCKLLSAQRIKNTSRLTKKIFIYYLTSKP